MIDIIDIQVRAALDLDRRTRKLRTRARREAMRAARPHYYAVRVVCDAPGTPRVAAMGAAMIGAHHWEAGDAARDAVLARYETLVARLRHRARDPHLRVYVERVEAEQVDNEKRRLRLLAALDDAAAELRRRGQHEAAAVVVDRAAARDIVVFS